MRFRDIIRPWLRVRELEAEIKKQRSIWEKVVMEVAQDELNDNIRLRDENVKLKEEIRKEHDKTRQ